MCIFYTQPYFFYMARTKAFDTSAVLDKAVQLFWHKGYNGISTKEMTDVFYISKSSMYGTYRSKMDWYIAALERYGNGITTETISRLQRAVSIKKEIAGILSDLVKASMTDKDHKGCFMVNSCIELAPHDEKIKTIVAAHRKVMEKIFAEAIKKGIATGEITAAIDAGSAAAFICTCISGIQTDAKYLSDKKYVDNVITSIMKILS